MNRSTITRVVRCWWLLAFTLQSWICRLIFRRMISVQDAAHHNDVIMSANLKSLLSRVFTWLIVKAQVKESPESRVTGLCEGKSPVFGEFHAQRASKPEYVSIWWRHHDVEDAASSWMYAFSWSNSALTLCKRISFCMLNFKHTHKYIHILNW